jgi:hypothetical protein
MSGLRIWLGAALHAAKIGGYVDAWNVESDAGWTMIGYVRYLSRRE